MPLPWFTPLNSFWNSFSIYDTKHHKICRFLKVRPHKWKHSIAPEIHDGRSKNSMLYTVYISGRLICDILETGNTALPFPEALRSFIVELLRSLLAFFINIDTWNLKVSLQTNSRPLADTFITPSRHYKARPIEELLCSKVCTEPTWQCAPL